VSLGVLAAVAVVMAATCPDPGVTWDEPSYIYYAEQYAAWLSAVLAGRQIEGVSPWSDWAIRRHWGMDVRSGPGVDLGQKHPPLAQLVSCAAIRVWGRALGELAAARTASSLVFGVLCASIYAFAARRYDERVALFAVLALVLLPRFQAHMRLATLEPLLALLCTLTVFAFARGVERRLAAVLAGVLFGLALLTKINAWVLPAPLAVWALMFHRRRAWLPLAAMALLGPLLFVALWPPMWLGPVSGLLLYFQDKAGRSPMDVYYFGRAYVGEQAAGWHYAIVMALLTTPALMMGAVGAAAVRCRREWSSQPDAARLDVLMALGAAGFILPSVLWPKGRADGVRLWLPAFPFLAVLAGRGAAWAWDRLRRRRRALGLVLACAAGAWAVFPSLLLHPFQMAYYNELAGGPWGARAMGMETTYWLDTLDWRVLAFLRAAKPAVKRVAFVPRNLVTYYYHRRWGFLTENEVWTPFDQEWDYLVVTPRLAYLHDPHKRGMERIRDIMARRKPVYQRYLTRFRDIPVCLVYAREEAPPPLPAPFGPAPPPLQP